MDEMRRSSRGKPHRETREPRDTGSRGKASRAIGKARPIPSEKGLTARDRKVEPKLRARSFARIAIMEEH